MRESTDYSGKYLRFFSPQNQPRTNKMHPESKHTNYSNRYRFCSGWFRFGFDLALNIPEHTLIFCLLLLFSGSSVRDESLYSTSTQKQSFDSSSVTLPIAAPGRPGIAQTAHSKVSFDSVVKVAAAKDTAHHAPLDYEETVVPIESSASTTSLGSQPVLVAANSNNRHVAAYQRKPSDIRLSIVNVRPPNQSKALGFLQRLIFWRTARTSNCSTRSLGYYSPPLEHHKVGRKSAQFSIECGGYMFEEPIEPEGVFPQQEHQQQDHSTDVLSSTGPRSSDEYALEDELTAYMAELRAREQR